jgi:hypothetical protein
MMMSLSHRRTAEERAERRSRREEREVSAGKLLARAPDLVALDIAMHESRPGSCYDNHFIRRVVIAHASALFEVACSYADCKDGGYDLTREVLSALARRQPRFEGEQACRGRCNVIDCTRVLRYVATASYRAAPDA